MMRLFHLSAAGSVALLLAGTPAPAATAYDDDFSDGVRGTQWSAVTDNAGRLNVAEQNGRLELLSAGGGSPNDDALYLSTFRLSTATDFTIRLDYSFTNYASAGAAGTALGLVFGVGRDADGTDSAAIGQGFGTIDFFGAPITGPAATVGYRTDNVPTDPAPVVSPNLIGTFEIRYDAAGDDLTLLRVGGGVSLTLADTVRTVWLAEALLVSFGGRGDGTVTTSGQAFVDNFTIVSGSVVPEPACLTAAAIAGYGLRRRRQTV